MFGHSVAYEFLCCESPACISGPQKGCQRQAGLCVPESWHKAEIQTDFKDIFHSRFFTDAATIRGGLDDDPLNGIEQANLLFFAGHGTPQSLTTWNNDDVPLTNFSAGGVARYIWLFSCNVMAHGPMLSAPIRGGLDFIAPEQFDKGMAMNVFRRWGDDFGLSTHPRSPLPPNLRMACGGSSELGGTSPFPTAAVWHYKLMSKLPVADSFLLGFAQSFHVPLCISRGGSEREKTPLYIDQEFSSDPNPSPTGDHLFIEYPVHLKPPFPRLEMALQERFGFSGSPPPVDNPQGEPPVQLPVLKLAPTPFPSLLGNLSKDLPALSYGFKGGSAGLFFPNSSLKQMPSWLNGALHLEDVCVKVQPKSGAVVFAWVPWSLAGFPSAIREHLLNTEDLFSFVASLGLDFEQWTGASPGINNVKQLRPGIEVLQMNVDGAETKKAVTSAFSREDIDRQTKCLNVRLKSWLQVQGTPVPILDEGSQWLIAGCPRLSDGLVTAKDAGNVCQRAVPSQLNLTWIGRQVTAEEPGTVLRLNDARKEARRRLAGLELRHDYVESSFRWGYKAAPVHCSQDRMYLVYRFDFRSQNDQSDLPITIEVPAHELPDGKQLDDTWTCDPETPEP
ncbi:MAG: hypothetical protein WAM82_18240 [Thermoanaerobaculia bacterium]